MNQKVEKLNKDIKTADRASIRTHIEHLRSELTDISARLNQAEKTDEGLPAGHRHA